MEAAQSIGTDRQLFVDEHWIAESHGVELRLHTPVRHEVAIAAEHPWEKGGVSYMVTFADQGKFRAWYRCDCQMPPEDSRVPLIGYAESDDGIHWTKPFLGLIEYEGSRDNNLVWAGPGNNMAPFRDDSPDAREEERYKAIVRDRDLYALTSPDGLRWRLLQQGPILTDRPFDSHNIAFWDTDLQRYAIYARGVAGKGDFQGGVRWIRRSLSEDFCTWSSLEPIDAGDTPFEHLYTNSCIQYDRAPGTYLMFPSRFVKEREPVPGWEYGPGVNDILFMSSRDGLHFHRFMEAFVRPGPDPENWHERAIFMERGILPASPTELSLYGMEHWRMPSVRIRRYSLRTDGFVSVGAGYDGGELVTQPMIVGGRELELNYSTSAAGSICVEIQRPSGAPVDGLSADACGEIFGDEIEGTVAWEGADLGALIGQPVRLRFVLRDADLYAFRFR
ncbi:hypothetical protein ACFL6X_04785 [Candidatus Latescibacterota bacterium]